MPAVRQPLRKRCNVKLSVVTSLSGNTYNDIALISKDDNRVRGRPQRRQRKMEAKRRKLRPSSTQAYLKREVAVTLPSPLPLPRSKANLQSYCELIPFLSIALSDGSLDPSTPQLPPTSSSVIPFTHFIEIHYPTPRLKPGVAWSEYNVKTCTSILNLVVPTTPQHEDQQNQTFLSEHQLLLSRDFLSLALPYRSGAERPPWVDDLPSADMVHVLITAPPGPSGSSNAAVDIMSIVACYLTFAGQEETTTVVQCVDAELDAFGSELANVWKGRVKGDGIEIIQKVAIAP